MIPFILGFICGFAFFVLIQAASVVLDLKAKGRGTNVPYQPTVPKMPVDSEKKIKCNGNIAQEK